MGHGAQVPFGENVIHCGDCLTVLPTLDACSVDSIVTDPPYGLSFMGKDWDHGIPGAHFWTEAMRVAKPGAFLLSFGGTRTFHRLACAIEDAGWELRDTIMWVYGSGFPKSHNGEWGGTALKPAWEPIIVARKPFKGTVEANWREHGTGGLNIDGCRVGHNEECRMMVPSQSNIDNPSEKYRQAGRRTSVLELKPEGRWPANLVHDGSEEVLTAFPDAVGQIADASSSSSSRKTQNVYGDMKRGNGRDGEDSANNDNTGSVGFKMKPGARRGDSGSAARFFYCAKASRADRNDGLIGMPTKDLNWSSGTQSPGTFQSPNTNRSAENHHPTVKPTELMRWLVRLVTPAGGTVLDPFMGSGSTGKAATLEGFAFVGIELNPEYIEIAQARIAAAAYSRLPDWLK